MSTADVSTSNTAPHDKGDGVQVGATVAKVATSCPTNGSFRQGSPDVQFAVPALPNPVRVVKKAPVDHNKNCRAGSIISKKNVNQPLLAAVEEEDENDGREFWTVKTIHNHGWRGITLFHEVEWDCNGLRSWEPLHHLNCLAMVVDYYKRIGDVIMAKAMEVLLNVQPGALRMHIKDCKFTFYTRAGMLNDGWMQRAFIHEMVEKAEIDTKLSEFNEELSEMMRTKMRTEGGAEFEAVNNTDGCVPPLPFGPQIEESEEMTNVFPTPIFPPRLPSQSIKDWLHSERNCDSNEHMMKVHAPAKKSRHTFITTLIYRNRFAEWDLRPLSVVKAGTKIMRVEGEVVDEKVADRYMRVEACEMLAFMHFFHLGEGKCLDRRQHLDYSRFLVHSCKPNCELRLESNAVYVHAKRDIGDGEALSIDYFPDVKAPAGEPKLKDDFVECQCGVDGCRGVLWIEKGFMKFAKTTRIKKRKAQFHGHEILSKTIKVDDDE